MKPALALIVFYLLLSIAVVVLRGDLTNWPRGVDRALAFVVCLGAVALLLRSWKAQQPEGGPADDGSSRPRPSWMWWTGLVGLAAFVFLAALPPVSVMLARPLDVRQSADGRESPGDEPPPLSDDGTVPEVDPSGVGPPEAVVAAAGSKSEMDAKVSLMERLRAVARTRAGWLIALFLLLALLTGGVLWWLVRRELATLAGRDRAHGPLPPWHDDPAAPAYVREFRRLCEHLGHPPRPGDTWRDLLTRLRVGGTPASTLAAPEPLAPLETVTVYHYRVRYEGAAADHAAEREFVRVIRAARKAATFPPATETATAA